jgi:molecular chaperone DnaK
MVQRGADVGGTAALGIDLGTTNTAAALFDGDTVELVRTAEGATLTPSVVRIDAKGRVTVGARARKAFDKDPENTRSEFKRLMGTDGTLSFPASGLVRRPEELAAEVLRSVRHDVQAQAGFLPERAVISVPALFELPQASATSEAARLAGFERVELIQEPVASALAAGWTSDDAGGSWLVYDLGGGTFDVSLLETRDGLLRVVGHDGDNFLGGRDIDLALVHWVLERLAEGGARVDRADRAHALALRVLRAAAEEAKIELTRRPEASISLPELFEVDGEPVDVEVTVDRGTLEGLMAPLIDRSLSVCERLLARHGQRPEQLLKVVLVGGPTVIPFLRTRVQHRLQAPFADQVDPMTVVARGASLYAATAGLDARPAKPASETGRRLWLQYPAMSADLTPFVAGRVLEGPEPAPQEVRFARADGAFASEWTRVDPAGTFLAMLELLPRRPSTFRVEGRGREGAVAVLPREITVVQGMTVTDPPLSRSVGVALASDHVRVYLERGTPLPAKRTFVHQAVDTLTPTDPAGELQIPIVQGELPEAHLCRLVGRIEIRAAELRGILPAGADVEVAVEVDRGGRLTARALIPKLGQVFEQVARLVVPDADPTALAEQRAVLAERLRSARRGASPEIQNRLFDVEWWLADAQESIVDATGGDGDAAQKARRLLLEANAALDDLEEAARWPELEFRAVSRVASASRWVAELGTEQEQRMLGEASAAVERARKDRRPQDLERHLQIVQQLGNAAYFRHPEVWTWEFEALASQTSRSTDLRRAEELVARGRASRHDRSVLREVVQQLWGLLPAQAVDRDGGHGSGVR